MTADCPYCGNENEINHDDGYGFEEDEIFEQQCAKCEKYFAYTTFTHFSYTARKAACMNGGKHRRKRTRTHPPQYARWRCVACGDEKPLTPAQKEQAIKINKYV